MLNIRIPTLVLIASLFATMVLVALNWQLMLATADLSLGIATIKLPLGLTLLALLTLIVAMFLFYVAYLQGHALIEARRFARELRTNQEKADNAEASRFTELQQLLREEVAKLSAQGVSNHEALIAATEQTRRALDAKADDLVNTVAAYVGELEDRIQATLPAGQRRA